MTINFEKLVKDLIVPIVLVPENINISIKEEKEFVNINLYVDKTDIGRVIGKSGKTVSAIRTILYTVASKHNLRVSLEVSSN